MSSPVVRLPPRLAVYEINTAVWLHRLGRERAEGRRAAGRPLRLDEVPGERWDELGRLGVDAVWLMGVWQRSPAGLEIARADPAIEAGNRATLPDLRDEDVIGSPYCVRDYVVDERFGGREALAAARAELAARGLGLILDYVPNHVAPDHPWCRHHLDYLLPGDEEELARSPRDFTRVPAGVVARGRDPYFPPWADTVQVNAFSRPLRGAAADLLVTIGDQCDGLRCDMAMLMTNEVFARTWGERGGHPPEGEFWPEVIGRVRQAHPEFVFIAEAYWDMEWALQQQGFDYCYDKRLYDRLLHEGAESVRGHLRAERSYQEGLIRFIENHDEPRAASVFSPGHDRVAAVVASTVPGARLYHDGQFDGRQVRIPVVLRRGPEEPVDRELRAFYLRLLGAVVESDLRAGEWRLCECTGWPDNPSYLQLGAWCWLTPTQRHLVVVNLAPAAAQARIRPPWEDVAGREWTLADRLDGARYERSGDEIAEAGLFVALPPWGVHFLAFTAP